MELMGKVTTESVFNYQGEDKMSHYQTVLKTKQNKKETYLYYSEVFFFDFFFLFGAGREENHNRGCARFISGSVLRFSF